MIIFHMVFNGEPDKAYPVPEKKAKGSPSIY